MAAAPTVAAVAVVRGECGGRRRHSPVARAESPNTDSVRAAAGIRANPMAVAITVVPTPTRMASLSLPPNRYTVKSTICRGLQSTKALPAPSISERPRAAATNSPRPRPTVPTAAAPRHPGCVDRKLTGSRFTLSSSRRHYPRPQPSIRAEGHKYRGRCGAGRYARTRLSRPGMRYRVQSNWTYLLPALGLSPLSAASCCCSWPRTSSRSLSMTRWTG